VEASSFTSLFRLLGVLVAGYVAYSLLAAMLFFVF